MLLWRNTGSTSNVPRNESQEPVGILHEEEVLENTLIEIEDDSSEMFSQPKQPATKKHTITVKKLPSAGKIEAKVKMFALMTDLEQKYLIPEQPIYPLTTIRPLNNFEQHLSENKELWAEYEQVQAAIEIEEGVNIDIQNKYRAEFEDLYFKTIVAAEKIVIAAGSIVSQDENRCISPNTDIPNACMNKVLSTVKLSSLSVPEFTESSTIMASNEKKYIEKRGTSQLFASTSNLECYVCKSAHTIYKCPKFYNLTVPERIKRATDLKLCMICLRQHERGRNAVVEDSTEVRSTVANGSTSDSIEASTSVSAHALVIQDDMVLLSTAMVLLRNESGQWAPGRVLLDSGSQSNLITEQMVQLLKLKKNHVKHDLCGIYPVSKSKEMYSVYDKIDQSLCKHVSDFLLCPEINPLHPRSRRPICEFKNEWIYATQIETIFITCDQDKISTNHFLEGVGILYLNETCKAYATRDILIPHKIETDTELVDSVPNSQIKEPEDRYASLTTNILQNIVPDPEVELWHFQTPVQIEEPHQSEPNDDVPATIQTQNQTKDDIISISSADQDKKRAATNTGYYSIDVELLNNNSLTVFHKKVMIDIFCCDAPARVFVLKTKTHTGFYSYARCTVKGQYLSKRACFPNLHCSIEHMEISLIQFNVNITMMVMYQSNRVTWDMWII
ncbi:Peptidase A2 domain-containing protein [Aphis craccivora]|uniref:Peptidase A2 domain-containing protein n=1 Tax=Aphis craccivora TaxID=307492 RepID=A0A6G0W844_APHCR|nr:Peptidase A2 domain-containing protein [Aphis craccivora]